ncbi:MAG: ABC-F family ATP-binding cassette domain-containing protein [Candidatus Krumholzibacteria bacterium]|nr:ABC-F family ATP-binding cassette domain-containing protein [Candidatus Krumholzibacteria bacterium]
MIIIEKISKSYGSQELFRNTGFRLNARERLGLVGRNGHGKTTLFRMIMGMEEPDAGSIIIPKGYSIGHVDQEPQFSESTVIEEGCLGLPEQEREHSWKVEKILAGLGFSEEDFRKHPTELSGGYQVRLNLAKVLVQNVDLLLLDEPNNYLDITSIRWLTRYLSNWQGELLLITHDRSFMDNIVTHTMGIYRKSLRKIKGNTGKLYSQLAMEEEVYEKTRLNDEKKRKKTELFIRRFRAKARLGNMVQSRIKSLQKQEKLEKLEQAKDLDFSFRSKVFNGRSAMHVKDLSFGYESGKPLFSELSFAVGPYERVCVIGKNGKGKTTLLKTIAGKLPPDEGEVLFNPTVSSGYYEQANEDSLSEDLTVLDEVMLADPDLPAQTARNICGMMMFEGDAALKKIKVLSGGEKNRVMMGKVIATPVSLLLLDEPTNHLDLESCDALLEAINEFEGAVVMVTHNEMLLHGLADRLIIFQDGKASVFEGGYQRFLEKRGWDDEKDIQGEIEPVTGQTESIDRKTYKRLRAELIRERAKGLKPLEKKIEDMEEAIVGAEADLEKYHEEMAEVSAAGESERIGEISKGIHSCQETIEESFAALEVATAEYHTLKEKYDEKMDRLDASAR